MLTLAQVLELFPMKALLDLNLIKTETGDANGGSKLGSKQLLIKISEASRKPLSRIAADQMCTSC